MTNTATAGQNNRVWSSVSSGKGGCSAREWAVEVDTVTPSAKMAANIALPRARPWKSFTSDRCSGDSRRLSGHHGEVPDLVEDGGPGQKRDRHLSFRRSKYGILCRRTQPNNRFSCPHSRFLPPGNRKFSNYRTLAPPQASMPTYAVTLVLKSPSTRLQTGGRFLTYG
jgi:hypothetical protein